jgi:ABC-type Fe3+-hydroxamate transport system substrate-binding protein
VTDETGRKVTVPDHPHRVICLVPSVTDTVFALGSGDDVVAVSDYTTYPPGALKKPSIGSLVKPSIETILSFHPDLVVGTRYRDRRKPRPSWKRWDTGLSGRPARSCRHPALGREPGRSAQSRSAGGGSQRQPTRRIEAVKARTVGKPAPRVLVPVWYDPIITIGKHAFITEIIEAAGARSVTDDLIPDWPQISMEAVITRAPEALLLIRGGKVDHRAYVAEAARLEQPSAIQKARSITSTAA